MTNLFCNLSQLKNLSGRLCEEWNDEAISSFPTKKRDCFSPCGRSQWQGIL